MIASPNTRRHQPEGRAYLPVGVLAAVPNALSLRTGSWGRPREPDRYAMGSWTDPR